MIVLGLTGSIGMGKSTTLAMFADEGIPVYSADTAVHELYAGEAVPLIAAEFPGTVVNGEVDRDRLSTAVLVNPDTLREAMATFGFAPTHPHVVVAPGLPVLCADRDPAGRLAGETNESYVVLAWDDLTKLRWM